MIAVYSIYYVMIYQIDLLNFKKATFGDELMCIVAVSFLAEVPAWRKELIKETDDFNLNNLADLFHKIKGSCFTISAFAAANQFSLAEESLKNGNHENCKIWLLILLQCIDQIEYELNTIIANLSKV